MSWQRRAIVLMPMPAWLPGLIPRAMRSYRRSNKMADEPKDARTMTDAEYAAAKAKVVKEGRAQQRANDAAAELRRISARFPERKPTDA
jgi:hypothetical protein